MAEGRAEIEERRQRVGLTLAGGEAVFEERSLVAGPMEGRPLLLLHGIAGSADEWLTVMPALAERYRVHAPDAPGHGFSEKPAGLAYDLETYTAAARACLESIGGGGPVPLVALSGGGTVALAIALSHPELISELILVDVAGIDRGVSWDYRMASLPGAALLFRRGLSPASSRAYGRRLLHHAERLPADWVERRMRIWATPNAVEAFFRTARRFLSLRGQREVYLERLHAVGQRTLIFWGENDPIIPVSHGHLAAARMPNARLHVFARCGHVPPWEYPGEFAERVVRFLGEP